jgi:hypothetical protein
MANDKLPYKRVTLDELVTNTLQDVPEAQRKPIEQLVKSLEVQWVLERERYETAHWLAKGLLWVFISLIILGGVLMLTLLIIGVVKPDVLNEKLIGLVTSFVKDLLPFIATPLGVALGFYFRGSRQETY